MSESTVVEPLVSPLVFAGGSRRLTGVLYHGRNARLPGVVMCNQVGPDYVEYYKTGSTLARLLAGAGIDCLRFDYTGWGDSAGNWRDGSVPLWISDIVAAAETLQAETGCRRVCLCGLGFGGLLAAAASGAASAVDALVFWDTPPDGQRYCRRLRERQRKWLRGSFVRSTRADRKLHAMGFPAPDELRRQMRHLKLQGLRLVAAREALVVGAGADGQVQPLVRHFRREGLNVRTFVTSPGALPLKPMRAMARWLQGGGGGA